MQKICKNRFIRLGGKTCGYGYRAVNRFFLLAGHDVRHAHCLHCCDIRHCAHIRCYVLSLALVTLTKHSNCTLMQKLIQDSCNMNDDAHCENS